MECKWTAFNVMAKNGVYESLLKTKDSAKMKIWSYMCVSQAGPDVQNGHIFVGNTSKISESFVFAKEMAIMTAATSRECCDSSNVRRDFVFMSSIACIRHFEATSDSKQYLIGTPVGIDNHVAAQFTWPVFIYKGDKSACFFSLDCAFSCGTANRDILIVVLIELE